MSTTKATAATAERVSALKTYRASELSTEDLLALTARPRIDFTSILETVHAEPSYLCYICTYVAVQRHLLCLSSCSCAVPKPLPPHILLMRAWAGEAHCGGCSGAGRRSGEGVHGKV